MLLIVVNYPQEIDVSYWEKFDFVDIQIIKESKGSVFALKLQKLLDTKKYEMVFHFGLCGGKEKKQIGELTHITRSFLRKEGVIESQKHAFPHLPIGLPSTPLVTKFSVGEHTISLYDFACIYDLETFRVAQVSALSSVPVITLKAVSDVNDVACLRGLSEEEEIDFLLSPEKKRTKKEMILDELSPTLDSIYEKTSHWFESTGKDLYERRKDDGDFRKEMIT